MTPPPWPSLVELHEVRERVREAARIIARMPARGIAGYGSAWPEIVRDYAESYGYERARAPRILPTRAEITRMEEVLGWFSAHLRDDQHRNLRIALWWSCAARGGLNRAARKLGVHRHTAAHWRDLGAWRIVERRRTKVENAA